MPSNLRMMIAVNHIGEVAELLAYTTRCKVRVDSSVGWRLRSDGRENKWLVSAAEQWKWPEVTNLVGLSQAF